MNSEFLRELKTTSIREKRLRFWSPPSDWWHPYKRPQPRRLRWRRWKCCWLCSLKKEGQYLQWSKNPPWNNGLAPRTSCSVVLQSSYSMVQLFSPTSGSQEFIAIVGSAQHKSLASCIAYRQGPGKRNSELLNASPALGTTIRSSKALQPKGRSAHITPWWKIKSREFSSSSHCETGILELLDDIRFRSVGDPRYHVSLSFCSSS